MGRPGFHRRRWSGIPSRLLKGQRAGNPSEDRSRMGQGLERLTAQDPVTDSSCQKAQMCQIQTRIVWPCFFRLGIA